MSEEVLRVEAEGPVVRLTLNRPDSMNALSANLRDALGETFRALQEDDAVRAIVLTGAGRAFCAGYDLKELAATMKQIADNMYLWSRIANLYADAATSSRRLPRPVFDFELPKNLQRAS